MRRTRHLRGVSRSGALAIGLAGVLLAALVAAWLLQRVEAPVPEPTPRRGGPGLVDQPTTRADAPRPAPPVPEHDNAGALRPVAVPPTRPLPVAPVAPALAPPDVGSRRGGADEARAAEVPAPPRERFALAKDGIQAAIRSKLPEIKDCYESWLRQNPGLEGRLKVSFTISGNDAGYGGVTGIQVLDGGLGHTFMEGCVLNAFNEIEFASPEGGGELHVTYPLVFSSDGGR